MTCNSKGSFSFKVCNFAKNALLCGEFSCEFSNVFQNVIYGGFLSQLKCKNKKLDFVRKRILWRFGLFSGGSFSQNLQQG